MVRKIFYLAGIVALLAACGTTGHQRAARPAHEKRPADL